MSIELMTAICAAVIAMLGFFLAKKQEPESKARRIGTSVCLLFGLVSILAGYEAAYRKNSMDSLAKKLDRDWIVLNDSPIEAIEFEIISPDGLVSPGLLHFAQNVTLEIPGVDLGPAIPHTTSGPIDFSQLFTIPNISDHGRVGITVARVTTSEKDNQKTIEKFQTVECMASRFITAETLRGPDLNRTLGDVCSAAVTVKLQSNALKLSAIATWPKISMSMIIPERAHCIGICKDPILVSMKLVFAQGVNYGEFFIPTMIEVSPFILRPQPSAISDSEHKLTFDLSGSALLDLAKSYFLESYGYREKTSFAFTMGVLNELYSSISKNTVVTSSSREMVFSTNASPDEFMLSQAIPPEKRDAAIPMRLQEWCGFGDHGICWYRFAIFQPASR